MVIITFSESSSQNRDGRVCVWMHTRSGVARVELVRGPVPGLARFYRPRSSRFACGRFARIAGNKICTIIHWAPRKRSHGSLGYLQHTLVLLERRRGKAPFAHHMHVLYYSHPRRYR